MKKFGIVFNHGVGEFSVYPIDNESSESSALENIKSYQKVARVHFTIIEAADMDAALQVARKMNARQYHEMPDTLEQLRSFLIDVEP
jgi:hypothetical protein